MEKKKPLCSIYQRYNLKAIHNNGIMKEIKLTVVLNISKIQSESNSQQLDVMTTKGISCAQYIKDTI